MEKVFASVQSPLEISVAVARTSQSPFPLCASVKDNDPTENSGQKNRKSKPF
jgi:hypothetical protein